MISIDTRRWKVYDKQKNDFFDISDWELSEGLNNHWLILTGNFMTINTKGSKFWVDAVTTETFNNKYLL